MRRIKKEKVIKEVEVTLEDKIICDLCAREGEYDWHEDGYPMRMDESDIYMKGAVKIKQEKGESWDSDEGDTTKQWFDLCPDCWESVLKPFLVSKGATCYKKEINW